MAIAVIISRETPEQEDSDAVRPPFIVGSIEKRPGVLQQHLPAPATRFQLFSHNYLDPPAFPE